METKERYIYDGFLLNKENFRSIMSNYFLNKKTDFTYKKLVLNRYSDVYGPIADRLGYIMSEKLKDAIIENGIKGITFRELDFEIYFTET